MSIKLETLKKLVKELIKQELNIREASVTGAIDGGEGPPKSPFAFQGKGKKDKDKEKRIATNSTGYSKVSEAKFHVRTELGSVIVDASGKAEAIMKVAKAMKKGRKAVMSANRVGVSKAKQVDKKLENVTEALSKPKLYLLKVQTKNLAHDVQDLFKAIKGGDEGEIKNELDQVKFRVGMLRKRGLGLKESVTEGRYHDYRNDDTLNAKQKIGYSMREVRDKLNELDKLVKMNVRLKNEIGVDSTSYWKRTHSAMKKISERLVKLANKVGQLY